MIRIAMFHEEEELKEASKTALINNLRDLEGTEEFLALQKEQPDFMNGALVQARSQGHYSVPWTLGHLPTLHVKIP